MQSQQMIYIVMAIFSLSLTLVIVFAQLKLFTIDKSMKRLVAIAKRQETLLKKLEAANRARPSTDESGPNG